MTLKHAYVSAWRRLQRYYRLYVSHDPEPIESWFRDRGDATLRLNYPLNPESVVLDVGGYHGGWSNQIIERYNPIIYIFEPCAEFHHRIKERFASNPKITVLNYGLSDKNTTATLYLSGDASSVFGDSTQQENIELRDVAEVISALQLSSIALMKVNIEGGEYALLRRLLSCDLAQRIDELQIQFHLRDGAVEMREQIRILLSHTHSLTYDYPFVWENWSRRR